MPFQHATAAFIVTRFVFVGRMFDPSRNISDTGDVFVFSFHFEMFIHPACPLHFILLNMTNIH